MAEADAESRQTHGFRYSAFISYSHSDSAWAKWLHNRLETYVVPPSFRSQQVVNQKTGRLRPVFRDRDELPGAASLSNAIVGALSDSAFLVVVCSPRAAKSIYVNREVECFRSLGRPDNILAIIVDGEPGAQSKGNSEVECFPVAMLPTDEADSSHAEPLAADARAQGDGKKLAVLKVLAAILGTNLGELRKRDAIRQRRLLFQRLTVCCVIAAVLAGVYLLASDGGFDAPGSEAIRTLIDRHEMSVLRPVPAGAETKAAAVDARKRYIDILVKSRLDEGRFPWDTPGDETHADTWSTCQALAALSRSPEMPHSESQRLLESFRRMFDPAVLKHEDGVPTGWQQRRGSPSRGTVALWITTALAIAADRSDLFDESARNELKQFLATATHIAQQYHSTSGGGWNMFGGMHSQNPDNYTSALALQTLLHLERADLPWNNDSARRSELLKQTAAWLVSTYDAELPIPGWRRAPYDESRESFDGMTIQIYALLLDAEAQQAVKLPAHLVENALLHIERCAHRERTFLTTTAEFEASVVYEGEVRDEHEGVGFLWHPWALEGCVRLLERHQRSPLPPEHLTRVRRARGHLVLLAGSDDALRDERLFAIAEMLYGLASVQL